MSTRAPSLRDTAIDAGISTVGTVLAGIVGVVGGGILVDRTARG